MLFYLYFLNSITTDQAVLDTIVSKFKSQILVLTPHKRMGGMKMRAGSIPFVKKILEHALQHQEIVSAFVDLAELKKK
ncbi:MAG: hypothetical protein ACOYO1_00590 [Bacteroidales bacterium]